MKGAFVVSIVLTSSMVVVVIGVEKSGGLETEQRLQGPQDMALEAQ